MLLRYLAGDETPQSRQEFRERRALHGCGADFDRRNRCSWKAARISFRAARCCSTRSSRRRRICWSRPCVSTPAAAYGFNALGIAYLEQAEYDKAIPAFHDAVRRAQHWSYPLHNEALAYVETGDYRSAIRAYQEAIRLTPQYSYLPYNLGLVYQRLNRRKDAETAYLKAEMLAPNSAEPYNALGTLKASEGKRDEAEQLYREALQKNPNLLPARHNLALLLDDEKGREKEAIDLWRENLRAIARLPAIAPQPGRCAGCARRQCSGRGRIPQGSGSQARLRCGAHSARRYPDEDQRSRWCARLSFAQVTKQDSQDPTLFERIGDLEAAGQHSAEARTAYQVGAQS